MLQLLYFQELQGILSLKNINAAIQSSDNSSMINVTSSSYQKVCRPGLTALLNFWFLLILYHIN